MHSQVVINSVRRAGQHQLLLAATHSQNYQVSHSACSITQADEPLDTKRRNVGRKREGRRGEGERPTGRVGERNEEEEKGRGKETETEKETDRNRLRQRQRGR